MRNVDHIKTIAKQEAELVFDTFDENSAFALGTAIRTAAVETVAPVVIDIQLWDRRLFFAALPGSTFSQTEWARRKINTVRMFGKSSFRVALEKHREDRTFPPGYGISATDYALAGGGFPVRVFGAGVIGAIAVSGLSQEEDHVLVVSGICSYQGKHFPQFALT